ncbi:5'-3' exoribonuclease 1 [Saccopteryx leptura]|uniref:5'-3' exoribonuclease 1 n=1 Tax=Saccopteryx leptura TaxID=249018 RepID=UPI00339BD814
MGVPKFYRWISERYPCLSEVVKEHQIPEFDNLYLDMNGIIHQCSHPNDDDVHFRISDDKIFTDIFHYLEVLFRIIKPRKVFFMAVDGVAPRAKMNQQRGRRFRSAKEAEDKIKKAVEKGETLPTEARFDSNCITPGTEFMARLHEHLKYFVNMKISTDKSWQGVTIYFSGHETPGEGEHKIMEFIRSEKAKPDHDPNTRHCLYGLDADLIMLGLTSHEAHFSLLREEVRFGGKKTQRVCAPEETTFHLLHLSLMREYIDYEFSVLKDKITFPYDIERIIDDWILMGFLVGNDFIPHLPHLHINHDALPLLYGTYVAILPELGGYINESGHLSLPRFEKYLVKLSDFDREHFSEVFVDLKWFESKVGNKYLNEAAGFAAEEARSHKEKKKSKGQENAVCWAALDKNREVVALKDHPEEETEEDDLFETEFRQYKRTYYMTKMGVDVVSDDFLAAQAACYVQAIQWILHYYYHGVQSWSWYYPYHYAPFLSDIRNVSALRIHFELGKPFKPFEQLLAVLPAASKNLLPECYQHLMTSEDSPIIEYYPPDFKTDLNGKQQEWEAVVLIPFIDEKRLLDAMELCNHALRKEERKRNQHSECLMYWFDGDTEFTYASPWPGKFPAIQRCCTRYQKISLDAWHVDISRNRITRVDQKALYFCGFPTLKHIRHKFFLKKSGVQVFQQSSRGENMMLEISVDVESEELRIESVAAAVLGKPVFVNWPHLEEARVVAVSDGETKFYVEEPPGTQKLYLGRTAPPSRVVHLGDKEQSTWTKEVQGISEQYLRRKGIIINETFAVVYAQLLTGRKYQITQNGEVRLEKQWSKQVLPFVYQTIVKDIRAFDSRFSNIKTLDDLFPPRSTVFMLGTPYYGCTGEVQDSGDVIAEGRIRVVFSIPCEPNLDALIQNQHKYSIKYNPGYVLASRLGVSGYLVSRFTGSIFIGRGSRRNPHGEHKANVGLNLKFNKKNEEVPGYTKKVGSEWMYSSAAEQLLAEYIERAPELFSYIAKNSQEDVFYEDDIWPEENENGAEKVQEIMTWLKGHPVSTLSRSSCDLQTLDVAIVERIEEEVEKCKQRKSNKKVRVTVKPHLLYRPLEQQHGVIPDRDADFRLFDRVVNVRDSFSVPVGLRGTVIGIKGASREADVLFEVLFDEEFPGGLTIRCSAGRGYRLPTSALVNLSHGSRSETGSQKLTAIVKPQPAVSQQSASPSVLSGQLGSLNHSPRSLFVPAQVPAKEDEFCHIWQSLQGSGKAPCPQPALPDKGAVLPQEVSQVTQPHAPGSSDASVQCQQREQEPHRKLKEECKSPNTESRLQKAPHNQPHAGFENFLASLNISRENEVPPSGPEEPPSEEHLSPQSFAMKGTRMLKEILKIDSSDAADSKAGAKQAGDEAAAPSGRASERAPAAQPGPGRRCAPYLNTPPGAREHHHVRPVDNMWWTGSGPLPPVATRELELCSVCSYMGLPPPDFSFLRTSQAMTVCQVKLPNGLLVHGPQCPSEREAKEKASFLALKQLAGSLGLTFPPPPPAFASFPEAFRPRAAPPTCPLLPGWEQFMSNTALGAANKRPDSSHLYRTTPWGPGVPVSGKPFLHNPYAGTVPGGVAAGVHNQFIPLQVTKKRAANKKNSENKEAPSSPANVLQAGQPASSSAASGASPPGAAAAQPAPTAPPTEDTAPPTEDTAPPAADTAPPAADMAPPAADTAPPAADTAPPAADTAAQGHTPSPPKAAPSSSSRRRSRKLAVNFGVPKPSE